MNYKLSLIIPVYNTAKYLKRCLDSVVNQTCFEQIEVIVVNDGSTDNSQLIIDAYAVKFNNIRSFVKSNGGLSDARNFGLQYVTGKYLAFLDSDDWVDIGLYADCINYMDKHTICNLVSFNYIEEWVGKCRFIDCHAKLHRSKYFMGIIACNKVFRTDFWQQHQFKFKFGIRHEDNELLPKIIYHANSYGFLENTTTALHYDRTNLSSITNSKRDTKSLDIVFNSLIEFNKKVNDPLLTRYIATTFFFQLVLFGGNPVKSWQVYQDNKLLFNINNVDSKYSKCILYLDVFKLSFIIKLLITFIHVFKIDPNKI